MNVQAGTYVFNATETACKQRKMYLNLSNIIYQPNNWSTILPFTTALRNLFTNPCNHHRKMWSAWFSLTYSKRDRPPCTETSESIRVWNHSTSRVISAHCNPRYIVNIFLPLFELFTVNLLHDGILWMFAYSSHALFAFRWRAREGWRRFLGLQLQNEPIIELIH